jgi:hypothetical protein
MDSIKMTKIENTSLRQQRRELKKNMKEQEQTIIDLKKQMNNVEFILMNNSIPDLNKLKLEIKYKRRDYFYSVGGYCCVDEHPNFNDMTDEEKQYYEQEQEWSDCDSDDEEFEDNEIDIKIREIIVSKKEVINFKNNKRICKYCKKTLKTFGNARANGKSHNDWESRNSHKSCWKKNN